jgi:hypothetical protein
MQGRCKHITVDSKPGGLTAAKQCLPDITHYSLLHIPPERLNLYLFQRATSCDKLLTRGGSERDYSHD